MPLYIAQSGDLDRCYRCLTDRLTTLKDSATQLLIKYKSGPLVTQLKFSCVAKSVLLRPRLIWLDRDAECGHGVKRWEV